MLNHTWELIKLGTPGRSFVGLCAYCTKEVYSRISGPHYIIEDNKVAHVKCIRRNKEKIILENILPDPSVKKSPQSIIVLSVKKNWMKNLKIFSFMKAFNIVKTVRDHFLLVFP